MAKRKGSKQKGNSFENQISKLIRAKFIPDGVDSKVAYNLIHRTSMSGGRTERGDIVIQPPVLTYFPFFIECRNRQQWTWAQVWKNPVDSVIGRWYFEDAVGKCHPFAGKYERFPLLVFTRNFHPNYFLMEVDHLLGIVGNIRPDWYFKFFKADKAYIISCLDWLLVRCISPHTSVFNGLEFK